MSTDRQLQQNVIAELGWDAAIDASRIGVEAKNGIVTLSGHVESYAQKWAAERAAQRVSGVKGIAVEIDEIRGPLEDALHAVLRGDAENDGFNRLVMSAGLAWRDVTILRAVGRYLRQAAIPFSLAYMEQALVRNAEVAALLVALFYARCMQSLRPQKT